MAIAKDVALSKLIVLSNDVGVISNNIANASTAGFQRRFMPYSEKHIKPGPYEGFSYVEDLAAIKDKSQGPFMRSDDPYHVFIQGEGAYFAVETARGNRYTRAGAFTLDNQGRLSTPQGDLVLSDGSAPIILPEGSTDIVIASDGTISDQDGPIARIGIFSFADPLDVVDEEDTLVNTTQAPIVAQDVSVIQYGYEGSNTNSIQETTKLLMVTAAYQQINKSIEEQNKIESRQIETYGKNYA
jgi:flagellar basal-body rod protein FlgF